MFTIEPSPASRIAGPKTSVALNTPTRLTSTVSRKAASSCPPPPGAGAKSIPALLTRTEGAACSPTTRSRTRRSDARSRTSACSIRAEEPAGGGRTSIPTTTIPAPSSADDQTGPRLPSAPVTMATRPARPSALIAAAQRDAGRLEGSWKELLEVLEGERRVLAQRVAERTADDVLQLVGRKPVARGLEREVLSAQDVPGRKRGRGDDLLAHLLDRRALARVRRLRPVAERETRALEVAHELAQPHRLQREAMVGALQRAVQREVLLDDTAPEHVGRDRHRDPVVVPRVADDGLGEELPVGLDHAQVEFLPFRGIAGRALEDSDMRIYLGDDLVRAPDVVERAAPGGEDHRLADLGDEAKERRVRQVAGRALVGRYVEVGQHLGALEVERRRKERDPELGGVRLQLLVLGAVELERFPVESVGRAIAVFVVVRAIEEFAGVERAVVPLLELDRIRSAARGLGEELLRLLQRPLMVVADLGDHVAVGVVRDPDAVDRQLSPFHGRKPSSAALTGWRAAAGAPAPERRTTRFPRTSTSIRVFAKVSSACFGDITIGSFSLNEVFRRMGTPVSFSNSLISLQ